MDWKYMTNGIHRLTVPGADLCVEVRESDSRHHVWLVNAADRQMLEYCGFTQSQDEAFLGGEEVAAAFITGETTNG